MLLRQSTRLSYLGATLVLMMMNSFDRRGLRGKVLHGGR